MYLPCINQDLKRLTFDVALPEVELEGVERLAALDSWLQAIFDEILELPRLSEHLPATPEWEFSVGYVSRALGLSCHLLQLIWIPVFHPGVLEYLGNGPQKGYCRVTAAVPFYEFYPNPAYQAALSLAFELLAEVLHKPLQSEEKNHIQDRVQTHFVKLWRDLSISNQFSVPILREAYRRNIPVRQVATHTFLLGWGSKSHLVQASALDTSSALGASLAQDKLQTVRLLKSLGVPVPEHLPVTTLEEAQAAASQLGYPVVVKPNDRDRGEGVSINVTNLERLQQAWSKARACSTNILVEKQVPGICYRIYIANDELIFVLRRRPKSVRGDGRHTIRQLIEKQSQIQEQQPPWKRMLPLPVDDQTVQCLGEFGLTLETILKEGEWAPLRLAESYEWGGVTEDVTDIIHPDNVMMARTVAAFLGLTIAGLDLISQDITVACHENGAVFVEANYAPSSNSASAAAALIGSAFCGDGRVPVEIYVGDQISVERARLRQQNSLAQGESLFLLVDRDCFLPTGEKLYLGFSDLASCCRSLLMRRDLDGLLLVIDDPVKLAADLPFDAVTNIYCQSSYSTAYASSLRRLIGL